MNRLFHACVGILIFLWLALWKTEVPTFTAVREKSVSSSVRLLARDGSLLATVRTDEQKLVSEWTHLENISPAFKKALLEQEDRRFYWHPGVDPVGVASAAFEKISGKRKVARGASTITMQLAGLLTAGMERPKTGRRLSQKIKQAWLACALETRWKKAQILEAYVNLVGFQGEVVGIEAAAIVLSGKSPTALDEEESQLLVQYLRAPRREKNRARRDLMRETKDRGESRIKDGGVAIALPTQTPHWNQPAWHLAARLAKKNGPRELHSSVDGQLQRDLEEQVRAWATTLSHKNVRDAAVIVVRNDTGEVLARVGGSGVASEAPYVDHTLARRQAGSTLKPFLYALAFEKKLLTPNSLLEDAPLRLKTSSGIYEPENYDLKYRGWMSVRDALAQSVNIPAVRAINMTTVESFVTLLGELGFTQLRSSGFYGSSVALGSLDVNLAELVNAYRTLANAGKFSPLSEILPVAESVVKTVSDVKDISSTQQPHLFPLTVDSTLPGVLSPSSIALVSEILSNNAARAPAFGEQSLLNTPFWSAVKTGTSKDMRDNWCVGFSRRYTVGAWVGNSDGTPMWNVTGVDGAAGIWAAALAAAEKLEGTNDRRNTVANKVPGDSKIRDANEVTDTAARTSVISDAVVTTEVQESPEVASSTEGLRSLLRFESPLSGSIYAHDPALPAEQERMQIRLTSSLPKGWKVFLGDGPLFSQGKEFSWPLKRGRWQLFLKNSDGKILERTEFQVR